MSRLSAASVLLLLSLPCGFAIPFVSTDLPAFHVLHAAPPAADAVTTGEVAVQTDTIVPLVQPPHVSTVTGGVLTEGATVNSLSDPVPIEQGIGDDSDLEALDEDEDEEELVGVDDEDEDEDEDEEEELVGVDEEEGDEEEPVGVDDDSTTPSALEEGDEEEEEEEEKGGDEEDEGDEELEEGDDEEDEVEEGVSEEGVAEEGDKSEVEVKEGASKEGSSSEGVPEEEDIEEEAYDTPSLNFLSIVDAFTNFITNLFEKYTTEAASALLPISTDPETFVQAAEGQAANITSTDTTDPPDLDTDDTPSPSPSPSPSTQNIDTEDPASPSPNPIRNSTTFLFPILNITILSTLADGRGIRRPISKRTPSPRFDRHVVHDFIVKWHTVGTTLADTGPALVKGLTAIFEDPSNAPIPSDAQFQGKWAEKVRRFFIEFHMFAQVLEDNAVPQQDKTDIFELLFDESPE
ncbi:hypothetical protein CC86DRAFT_463335 [Ophiobolus disseminans]|uniref:Uncharacterized protein n=1 Tax=Ophiobolus disseminans TaxID=1469910 RepID=A0A6A7AFJ5_9PLEO|nr:hypothetical protein CC86DRAFT_463335 [Ophiobolus disseminans]